MGSAFPDELKRRVEQFNRQSDQIRSPDYNEHLIRVDFIDPLMKELGWDMNNRQGFAEQYREVVHEDRVKVVGQTKAPDYSFRIGGVRKFFLEAKKPSVDIKNNWEPAYQLRRYAWSAKLAVSLLTDFEEFAIYDARLRPKEMEKPSIARREYLKYTEYEARWDFLSGTFSKDAVLRGAFDRYCDSKKGRGAELFDDAFLGEIEEWRKSLASNLARRNEALDEAGINFAVQRIIDRILFLRIAEDRGTEPVGQLQALLNGEHTYARLRALFTRADERYNSGLFHFSKEKDRDESPDTLTPTLDVDDKTLKTIVKGLYYPQSPYEFTMVSADILGSVYERFLGKVITLTAGHTARIEEKPEVRKAGGVYYTPVYIVDYIVKNTVGKLLEGRGTGVSPVKAEHGRDGRATTFKPPTLKILDPACGSGSFLIGAYQFLLDWYLAQYTSSENPAALATGKNAVLRPAIVKSVAPEIAAAEGPILPGWSLTIAERKRILIDHLHGVDLDGQAVEVTKLNLLLKCLEGETSQTLGFEQRLFRERALPDLGKNILCGNSLIGTDIIGTPAWEGMTQAERGRVNPFDYERAFPQVFKSKGGGFDAVIGNPPYVRMEAFASIKDYLETHYQSHEERADLYAYILEKGISVAGKTGIVGQIVSNKFIRAKYGKPLRRFIRDKTSVECIADFAGADVFHGATVRTVVILLKPRSAEAGESLYVPVPDSETMTLLEGGAMTVDQHAQRHAFRLAGDAFDADEWRIASAGQSALLDKIRQDTLPLHQAIGGKALFGLKTGCNEAFVLDEQTATAIDPKGAVTRPLLIGREIRRYDVDPSGKRVIYFHPDKKPADAPAVRDHLAAFKPTLESRAGKQQWWELQQPAVGLLKYTGQPKIIYPIIANKCRFTLDRGGYLVNDKAFMLPTSDLRILGVLNSRVANYYFGLVCAALEGESDRYLEFRAQYVDLFPLPPNVLKGNERLITLVDTMLALHKRLSSESLPQRREQIEREIAATDRQIDQLVYQLYGLSDAEIEIVEAATAR